ncbi:VWA domain-containing protein [Paenibacillus sp. CMAA1364]
MGIQFSHPWLLLLLIPFTVVMIYAYRSDYRLTRSRKRWAIGIRSVILLLLVLILSGIQTYTVLYQKEVVYVVDRSFSMPDGEELQHWMEQSSTYKEQQDLVSIVSSGLGAAVERKLSSSQMDGVHLNASLNREFSHLEAGMQLGSGMLSNKSDSRLVMITDGEENVGSMLSAGRLLQDRGIVVDILESPQPQMNDVAVEELNIPDRLYQAEAFYFEVMLRSTYESTGELRLYEDNREIGRQQVEVTPGDNRYAMKGLAQTTGLHRYRAEIFIDGDEQSANNVGYSFTRVEGPPKVLVVEGDAGTSGNITAALTASLIRYDLIAPEVLPSELAKYGAYDSIVFNNVSGNQVGGKQMELIEQAVRSYGIGFMMAGGENSFGMGGYFKTPIEKLLPVSMDLEGKREIPSMALILVIDRSGSMGGDKIELAKEAAIRTVELLRPKDTVGVVAFDSQPWWVVTPTKMTNKDEILGQIQSIQPQGGTEIYPAVREAVQQLLQIEAQRKHIILLTDGQSEGNTGYDGLIQQMTGDHMTLSSVAVGADSDTVLLQTLAEAAKGRYYFVQDATTIPAIFSREAVIMAQSYIVDKPFTPAMQDAGDWQSLFEAGAPNLNGYVATTAKSTAQTVLVSPEPDPILARWQYGSGRSVAWTSDVTGKWSKDWVSWSAFPNILTQMIKWTFPQFIASPYDIKTEVSGNQVQLQVMATEDESPPDEILAIVTGEDLKEQEVKLYQESPGQYTGELMVNQPGAFMLSLVDHHGDDHKMIAPGTGFVVPYSPEYRIGNGRANQMLRQLAELTGGRMLSWDQPEQLFAPKARPSRMLHDISYVLLVAALLLWTVDIAVRRLALPWAAMGERIAAMLRRRPAPAGEASPDAGVTRLAARKERAAAFYRSGGAKPPLGAPPTERGGAEVPSAASVPPPSVEQARQPKAEPSKEAAAANAPPQDQARSTSMDRLLAAKKRNSR